MEEDSKRMIDEEGVAAPESSEESKLESVLTYVIVVGVLLLLGFTLGMVYSLARGSGGPQKQAFGYSIEPVTDHEYVTRRRRPVRAAGNERRNYTLVCVFEYPRKRVWPAKIQCTDYVFIRLFSFTRGTNIQEFQFQSDVSILKNASQDEFQRAQQLERDIHANFNRVRQKYRHATWYIGMWGAMYTRMRTLASFSVFRDSLHKYLNTGLQRDGWRKSDFHGLGIVHTIPPHDVHRQILEEDTQPFTGNLKRDLAPPNWKFLHTIAPTWDDPLAWKPFMYHNLKNADIAGILTSNTMYIPYWIAGNLTQMWRFSAPNPTFDLNSQPFMLELLGKFPDFEIELNRTDLCISVTTAVNYGAFPWDAIRRMKTPDHSKLQRYSQPQFANTSKRGLRNRYFQAEGFRGYISNTKVFLQEEASHVQSKVGGLLSHYSTGKCIVLDDIGEDGDDRNGDPYQYLRGVSTEMEYRFGKAFREEYYHT